MNKKHGAWSKNEKIFLGLLAPILVLFFCFNTLPLIKGFYYGLTNFRGYGSYDFVGLRNFAEIFQDSRVGHSYLFTFKYALVMTIVVNLLSLIREEGVLHIILIVVSEIVEGFSVQEIISLIFSLFY